MRRFLPFVFLLLTGCSNNADNPVDPGYWDPHSPTFTSPDSTLATLARAVHDRSVTNYGLCFADTLLEGREFHASFDPADGASYPGVIGPWRRNEEIAFFPGFVAVYPNELYETEFTIDNDRGGILNIGGPTELQIWNVRYRVRAGTTPVVGGGAMLRFERIGPAREFKITYWQDRRDIMTAITWGKRRLDSL